MIKADRLLSTQEVADRLGVDVKTVRRWIQQGKLRSTRIGRDYKISPADLELLMSRPSAIHAAIVTAIVNQKGGVGKTTTTFNLGVALHRMGRKVLLIDMDPQGALTVSAGIEIGEVDRCVYHMLLDERVRPASVVHTTASGPDIIPADIDLAGVEVTLMGEVMRELVLKNALESVLDVYDHILIDCPPSLGLLTINALSAADRILIPVICQHLATRGIHLLLDTYNRVRRRVNSNLTILGVLPTMYDGRTVHAQQVLTDLRLQFGDEFIFDPIRSTIRVPEASAAAQSVFEYRPTHDLMDAYLELARRIDNGHNL